MGFYMSLEGKLFQSACSVVVCLFAAFQLCYCRAQHTVEGSGVHGAVMHVVVRLVDL